MGLCSQFVDVCFRDSAADETNRFNDRLISVTFHIGCPVVIRTIARFCLFIFGIDRVKNGNFEDVRVGQDFYCYRRFSDNRRYTIGKDSTIYVCVGGVINNQVNEVSARIRVEIINRVSGDLFIDYHFMVCISNVISYRYVDGDDNCVSQGVNVSVQ